MRLHLSVTSTKLPQSHMTFHFLPSSRQVPHEKNAAYMMLLQLRVVARDYVGAAELVANHFDQRARLDESGQPALSGRERAAYTAALKCLRDDGTRHPDAAGALLLLTLKIDDKDGAGQSLECYKRYGHLE